MKQPVIVTRETQLREIMFQMKAAARKLGGSVQPSEFAQTETELKKRVDELKNNNFLIQKYLECETAKFIFLGKTGKFINIGLTEGNKRQFHISFSSVQHEECAEGLRLLDPCEADEESINTILQLTFKTWEEIPNPTKVSYVRHFEGDE